MNFPGYKLKCSGREITPNNFSTLTQPEAEELFHTNATLWDILVLREHNHNISNSLQAFMSQTGVVYEDISEQLKTINKKLTVTVVNGETKIKDIGEVVAELAQQHTGLRKRERLYKSVKENRIFILIIIAISLASVTLMIDKQWFWTALVPIAVTIIKLLIK